MSKSLGNFITIKEALNKAHPMWIRLLFISTKYSSPIDFSEKNLHQMNENYERIKNGITLLNEALLSSNETRTDIKFRDNIFSIWKAFISHMEDDFDTSRAIADMYDIIKEINKHISNEAIDKTALKISKHYLNNILFILGISIDETKASAEGNEEALLTFILSLREKLRKEKRYNLSDDIRDELSNMGYEIYDTPKGPKARKKR